MVTLFCPPWCIPDLHTKSLFEKRDLVRFWTWMEWDLPFPWLKEVKTNSCTKRIYNSLNIHHWTKTQNQYIHGSLKIDVVTWNSHYNTHIMIKYLLFQCTSHIILALWTHILKTNFGNTHIELLNLSSLKMFTYAIPKLYLKPTLFENPM
jgi:hypothetical protein